MLEGLAEATKDDPVVRLAWATVRLLGAAFKWPSELEDFPIAAYDDLLDFAEELRREVLVYGPDARAKALRREALDRIRPVLLGFLQGIERFREELEDGRDVFSPAEILDKRHD